jgi:hypothetical protein
MLDSISPQSEWLSGRKQTTNVDEDAGGKTNRDTLLVGK